MYDEKEFLTATYQALVAHGVPADQAQQCAEILNQQVRFVSLNYVGIPA